MTPNWLIIIDQFLITDTIPCEKTLLYPGLWSEEKEEGDSVSFSSQARIKRVSSQGIVSVIRNWSMIIYESVYIYKYCNIYFVLNILHELLKEF